MSNKFTVAASAARTTTGNSDALTKPAGARGVYLMLNITAASGTTPTLDVTVERYDHVSNSWIAIPGAALAQKTTTGADDLIIYPGIAETANRSVSDALLEELRVVWTIAGTTPSFTFTIGGQWLT